MATATHEEAEALGVRKALQWLPNLHPQPTIVKTNAKNVVDALQSTNKDLTQSWCQLIEDCRSISGNTLITFSRVPRQGNSAADCLTKMALISNPLVLYSEPPRFLHTALAGDNQFLFMT